MTLRTSKFRVVRFLRKFSAGLDLSPLAASLGFLGAISGASGILNPNNPLNAPVHALFHGLDILWAIVFFLGGLLLLMGMGLHFPRLEAAGCALFAGGAFSNGVAFVAFAGWR